MTAFTDTELYRSGRRNAMDDAPFDGQSHSIPDNVMALSRRRRAWNCWAGNCGCTERDQQPQCRKTDSLVGWVSAIQWTADHASVVRQVAVDSDSSPCRATAR